MRLPKLRHVLGAILMIALVLAIGLVIAQDQETLRVRTSIASEDPRFPDYLARLLGHPITTGDRYVVLRNGDGTFPAMLRAIDAARTRISFETYIYESGEIAEAFTKALANAARRGVKVQILLDAVGSARSEAGHIEQLQEAGCEIGWFNPVRYYTIEEVNYRTHRKILVVDGEVAFVGGVAVADHWAGDAQDKDHWRDTQIEIHGPAVDNIEAGFHENWIETGGVVEPVAAPRAGPREGQGRSIVVWSSPEGGANELKLLYLLSIAAARRTLDIQSPYFITDKSSKWSLAEARKRGVRVRLLTEGDITDAKPVKFAGRADYERFLAQGIEVYEYQPTMMHAKAIVVDGIISITGSANFDNRSLELNDEMNVVAADRELAAELTSDFERDLKRSKKIGLDEWRARPFHIRAREKLWSYFGEVF